MTSSNEYVIIGIDPGLMTGTFVYQSRDGYTDADHLEVPELITTCHQFLGWWAATGDVDNVHIAIERYIITPKTAKLSQQTEALEVTGMVKAIAAIHGVTDVRQYAKSNLKFASDDMMRGVGWHSPSFRHANDAARQAFALLKDVDYPRWSELVRDAKIEPTTEG